MISTDTPAVTAQPVRADSGAVDVAQQTVGILGGTGPQGRGLAYRLARAGQPVVIGSRAPERARDAPAQLGLGVTGGSNIEAARHSDIVIITVPWEGHAASLKEVREELAGKLARSPRHGRIPSYVRHPADRP
jgi:3-hydroxyisobutyrate dehydrogenase-like beta-hydroxyacid dehydrogenase